jgi:excisionase family DNA binding protein
MTMAEVAAHLGVSRTTVYDLVKRRGLPAFRIGFDWRFSVALFDDWLKEQEKAPAKVKS